jgi:hypothetical protein
MNERDITDLNGHTLRKFRFRVRQPRCVVGGERLDLVT